MSIQLRRYQNPKDADSLSSLGLDQGQPAILDMTSGTEQYDNTLVATNASNEFGRYISSQSVGGSSDYYMLDPFPVDIIGDNGSGSQETLAALNVGAAPIYSSSKGSAYNPNSNGAGITCSGISQKGSQAYFGIVGKLSTLWGLTILISPLVSTRNQSSNITRMVVPGLPKPTEDVSGYMTLLVHYTDSDLDSTISFARNLVNVSIEITTNREITFSSKTIPASWYCSDPYGLGSGEAPAPMIFPIFTKNPLSITPSSYSTLQSLSSAIIDAVTATGSTGWTSIDDISISYECESSSIGDTGIPINKEYSVEVPYCNIKYKPDTFPTEWSKIRNMPTWVVAYGRREISIPPSWLTETYYEEGKWSAELSDCTLTTNSCWYRKEGPIVFIGAYLRIGTDSHTSGNYIVSGLPFSSEAIMGVSTFVQANLYVSTTAETHTAGNQNHFCRTVTSQGIQLTYNKTTTPETNFSGEPIYISGWYLTSDS